MTCQARGRMYVSPLRCICRDVQMRTVFCVDCRPKRDGNACGVTTPFRSIATVARNVELLQVAKCPIPFLVLDVFACRKCRWDIKGRRRRSRSSGPASMSPPSFTTVVSEITTVQREGEYSNAHLYRVAFSQYPLPLNFQRENVVRKHPDLAPHNSSVGTHNIYIVQ